MKSEDDVKLIAYPRLAAVATLVGGLILPADEGTAYGWRCLLSFSLWMIAEMVCYLWTLHEKKSPR